MSVLILSPQKPLQTEKLTELGTWTECGKKPKTKTKIALKCLNLVALFRKHITDHQAKIVMSHTLCFPLIDKCEHTNTLN